MSISSDHAEYSAAPLPTDTLTDSVLILLALTVVQRMIGFVRAMVFCRWLDAEQLGLWDMAFSFLLLAAPLAVLSLPGAFGRYLERYRRRGQTGMFVRRAALACGCLGATACASVILLRHWLSAVVFGTPRHADLIALAAACLAATTVFNFMVELFTAMRSARLAAAMQFINGVVFALLGVGLLWGWRCSAESVLAAYGGSCLIAAATGGCIVRRVFRGKSSRAAGAAGHAERVPILRQIAPYALWLMAANVLLNLFEVVDRYLIVHFSGLSETATLDMVGNYHAARVAPMLVVSVALLLAVMILPHLSHDWEAGRRERAASRLLLMLKILGLGFFAAGTAIAIAAPLLFDAVLRGKYPGGLAVLPSTTVYCIWFGMAVLAQNYLLCTERARLGAAALAGGLVLGVPLNLLLLPRLGLPGAVLATAAANALTLWLICRFNRRLGFRLDDGARLVMVLPMTVCLGPWVASAALGLALADSMFGNGIFSADEKRYVARRAADYAMRFGLQRMAAALAKYAVA
jgi:PST family polysaccharide transporter